MDSRSFLNNLTACRCFFEINLLKALLKKQGRTNIEGVATNGWICCFAVIDGDYIVFVENNIEAQSESGIDLLW